MIIAMDGPAGTGKSTIASLIAKKLKITYLNSGSFYRALTMALNSSDIDISDSEKVLEFAKNRSLNIKIHDLCLMESMLKTIFTMMRLAKKLRKCLRLCLSAIL